ncbi:MAG: hypothetical protein KAI70_03690 [Candidatus Omnitrophica bacterium]|nr:hypothetical protein [Candidatus Omnitrophota bacterium]
MRVVGKDTERGVFLPEVMVASTIMILAVVALVTFYMTVQVTWIEADAQVKLQQDARLTLDMMARGQGGISGIMEGTTDTTTPVNIPNVSTIEYTSGIDSIERSFYLSGNDIFFDPDTGVVGDEVLIAGNANSLTFTLTGNVVTIVLSMQDQIRGKVFNVDLSTDVLLRN